MLWSVTGLSCLRCVSGVDAANALDVYFFYIVVPTSGICSYVSATVLSMGCDLKGSEVLCVSLLTWP